MNRYAVTALMLAALAVSACQTIEPNIGEPHSPPGTDAALDAVATWKHGESRAALTAIEDMVRDAMGQPEQERALALAMADMLDDPNVTPDAKMFFCRKIAEIGGPEVVPHVAPLLTEDDTHDMARYALEPIPGDEVDQAFIDALGGADPAAKVGLVNSLGARGVTEAADDIRPLTDSSNAELAQAARSALAKLGP